MVERCVAFGKVQYATKGEAIVARRALPWTEVYRCSGCKLWHLASRAGKAVMKRGRRRG